MEMKWKKKKIKEISEKMKGFMLVCIMMITVVIWLFQPCSDIVLLILQLSTCKFLTILIDRITELKIKMLNNKERKQFEKINYIESKKYQHRRKVYMYSM